MVHGKIVANASKAIVSVFQAGSNHAGPPFRIVKDKNQSILHLHGRLHNWLRSTGSATVPVSACAAASSLAKSSDLEGKVPIFSTDREGSDESLWWPRQKGEGYCKCSESNLPLAWPRSACRARYVFHKNLRALHNPLYSLKLDRSVSAFDELCVNGLVGVRLVAKVCDALQRRGHKDRIANFAWDNNST